MQKLVKVYIDSDTSSYNSYLFVKEYQIKNIDDINNILNNYYLLHYHLKYNLILDDTLYLIFEQY